MELRDALEQRQAVKRYRPDREISDDELRELFQWALRAPSSYNLQHWRFVVVRDPARKKTLCEHSWNQRHVSECSAVIVVLGNLKEHRQAARIFADAPEQVQECIVPIISGFYQGKPELQRDEAIRSGSLVSLALMLVAQDMGLATCPMIGFDPQAVSEFLGLDENHIPVMMITMGEKATDPPMRSTRLPMSEVVRLEEFNGNPLADR
jgi:nitroreductase